jgi:hypothetical protein
MHLAMSRDHNINIVTEFSRVDKASICVPLTKEIINRLKSRGEMVGLCHIRNKILSFIGILTYVIHIDICSTEYHRIIIQFSSIFIYPRANLTA